MFQIAYEFELVNCIVSCACVIVIAADQALRTADISLIDDVIRFALDVNEAAEKLQLTPGVVDELSITILTIIRRL